MGYEGDGDGNDHPDRHRAVIILIGIAVIAFLLWQIKKAIDKLEANRRKLNLGPSLKLTAQGAGTLTARPGPPRCPVSGRCRCGHHHWHYCW
jgi:hypothetical protein